MSAVGRKQTSGTYCIVHCSHDVPPCSATEDSLFKLTGFPLPKCLKTAIILKRCGATRNREWCARRRVRGRLSAPPPSQFIVEIGFPAPGFSPESAALRADSRAERGKARGRVNRCGKPESGASPD